MAREQHSTDKLESGIPSEELQDEFAAELPERDLLLSVSLLGIPVVAVDGLSVGIS